MSIIITVNQKGARLETVESIVKSALKEKYPNVSISIERKEPAESRPDRFSDAQSLVSDAKSEAESLRDELQDWKDNLPENLQNGGKADELDDAISSLEEFIEHCDGAESTDVSFPGMY